MTRAGGCHYTNAALQQRVQPPGDEKNAPGHADLKIIDYPTWQHDMYILFLHVQLLIGVPTKQRDVFKPQKAAELSTKAQLILEVITSACGGFEKIRLSRIRHVTQKVSRLIPMKRCHWALVHLHLLCRVLMAIRRMCRVNSASINSPTQIYRFDLLCRLRFSWQWAGR